MNKKRYCRECGELTRPATLLDWFARREPSCSQCHNQYDTPDDYDCPSCGWPLDIDDYTSFASSSPHCSHYDGGESWTEHHKCPECGTEWEFDNGT